MLKWLQRLLKSIEDANKSNFGDQKMDCCDLNKKNNNVKSDKTN